MRHHSHRTLQSAAVALVVGLVVRAAWSDGGSPLDEAISGLESVGAGAPTNEDDLYIGPVVLLGIVSEMPAGVSKLGPKHPLQAPFQTASKALDEATEKRNKAADSFLECTNQLKTATADVEDATRTRDAREAEVAAARKAAAAAQASGDKEAAKSAAERLAAAQQSFEEAREDLRKKDAALAEKRSKLESAGNELQAAENVSKERAASVKAVENQADAAWDAWWKKKQASGGGGGGLLGF